MKIGDRVEVIKHKVASDDDYYKIGDVGTVVYMETNETTYEYEYYKEPVARVYFDGGDFEDGWWAPFSDLKVIE